MASLAKPNQIQKRELIRKKNQKNTLTLNDDGMGCVRLLQFDW